MEPKCSDWTKWTPDLVDPCRGVIKSQFVNRASQEKSCPPNANCEGYIRRVFNHSVEILYGIRTNNRTVADEECRKRERELYTGFEIVGKGNWSSDISLTNGPMFFWTAFEFIDGNRSMAVTPKNEAWLSASCTTRVWGSNEPNGEHVSENRLFLTSENDFIDAGFSGPEATVACDYWDIDHSASTLCSKN